MSEENTVYQIFHFISRNEFESLRYPSEMFKSKLWKQLSDLYTSAAQSTTWDFIEVVMRTVDTRYITSQEEAART